MNEQFAYHMKLDALRRELATGATQAEAGEFVPADVETLLREAQKRGLPRDEGYKP